ncbi:hypothetical protein [Sinorhizobium fredii]|uniref:hypothetical protein n=1 Tax=Rhizobium fredii TaxID=380 RepID=UPI00129630BB|nr:hypothetical protein [Sinorhizobium fredii]MQW94236.1 hypothetical protein [Sinorhizobium fredii]MQW95523.1 hypothetical protein [Sinorhizobium fredii]UTY46190.1 hypothetical protein EPK84_04485 [Sinorhizobium fredii]
MALYVICRKISNAFRNLFARRAHCVSSADFARDQTMGRRETAGQSGTRRSPKPFPATATTNQKANVVISDGAGFHPQQIPLTHVNQVSVPPFGPVAKRSASIIVRLTWVRHAGSGRIEARSHALRIAGERHASAAEPRINSWRRE